MCAEFTNFSHFFIFNVLIFFLLKQGMGQVEVGHHGGLSVVRHLVIGLAQPVCASLAQHDIKLCEYHEI